MTAPTPQLGADPGMPARNAVSGLTDDGPRTSDTLLTMEGRLAAWAAWFGLDPCPIKRGRGRSAGSILLNDALLQWMVASGGSLDWFVTGDLRGMAAAFRRSALEAAEFKAALRNLNDTEAAWLLEARRLNQEGGVPLGDALALFRAKVEAHRAHPPEVAA